MVTIHIFVPPVNFVPLLQSQSLKFKLKSVFAKIRVNISPNGSFRIFNKLSICPGSAQQSGGEISNHKY